MRTLRIRIERDSRAALRRGGDAFRRAWRTGRYQSEVRSFESPAALFRVLTPARWGVIERLQALGPSGLRALARALERDVKSVHRDVRVLIEERLVEKDAEGRLVVPFDRIRAEFDMERNAA